MSREGVNADGPEGVGESRACRGRGAVRAAVTRVAAVDCGHVRGHPGGGVKFRPGLERELGDGRS